MPLKQPKVSLIIPVFNESTFIEGLLNDIEAQDYPTSLIEVIVVDGHSTDGTKAFLERAFAQKSNRILLENPRKITPVSLNIGLENATGDFIIRWDAHAGFPENYISSLIRLAIETNADNVGGICITASRESTWVAESIIIALSSSIGVGNSVFRTGADEIMEVDTVPFGCFKRSGFEQFGKYDERLERNQDIELNKRIINGGGKILLDPSIECIYYARSTYPAFAKNNFDNGKWVLLTTRFTKSFSSLSLRHFVPFAWVGFVLLSLVLLACFAGNLPTVILVGVLGVIGLYLGLISYFGAKATIGNKKPLLLIPFVVLSLFLLHFSYGLGSMVGLLMPIKKK